MTTTLQGSLDELCEDFAVEIEKMALDGKVLRVIGFAGAPGAGKSLAVSKLLELLKDVAITSAPLVAGVIPMDGFHKSNAVLAQEGLSDIKGAPDTFDVVGYLMMLDRAHTATTVVYAPDYDRKFGEPIAARHKVAQTGIVFTEGNYLASQDGAWSMVREAIDLLIYLDVPAEVCSERLLERHLNEGMTPELAQAFIARVDEPNRLLTEGSRHRADRIWIVKS